MNQNQQFPWNLERQRGVERNADLQRVTEKVWGLTNMFIISIMMRILQIKSTLSICAVYFMSIISQYNCQKIFRNLIFLSTKKCIIHKENINTKQKNCKGHKQEIYKQKRELYIAKKHIFKIQHFQQSKTFKLKQEWLNHMCMLNFSRNYQPAFQIATLKK